MNEHREPTGSTRTLHAIELPARLGHKSNSSIPASFMRCFCRPRLSDASPCTGTEIWTTEPLLA